MGKCLTRSRTSSSGRSPASVPLAAGPSSVTAIRRVLRRAARSRAANSGWPEIPTRRAAAATPPGSDRRRAGTAARSGIRPASRTGWHDPFDRRQPLAGAGDPSGHRLQQRLGVRVAGVLEDGPHAALLDDPPGVHDDDAVGHLGDDAEVVGDEQDRRPGALLQPAQQVEDLRLHRDVEGGGRLVGDEQLRVHRQRHGDHHTLALAAGELVLVALRSAPRDRACAPSSAARRRGPGRRPCRAAGGSSAPRRAGSRPCTRGRGTSPGPGRSSRSRAPRIPRSWRSGSPTSWRPLNSIEPAAMRPVDSSSPRMDSAVTLLPEPDSPTSATVSPRSMWNDTSLTASTSPRRVRNVCADRAHPVRPPAPAPPAGSRRRQ